MKKIIITADDLGIDRNINRGIIESYKKGMLSSAALLMNAPETDEGIVLAKENPGLEVGIHLSIVEGKSLTGKKSTVTDDISYFDNSLCLIRDWKNFIKKYYSARINFNELEDELELQVQKFLENFPGIPFVNGTQHMHILPRVWKIVHSLCIKYKIKGLRIPTFEKPSVLWLNKRFPFLVPFQMFGYMARRSLKGSEIKFPAGGVIGMQYSGKISEKYLLKIMKNLPENPTEIVMHPGYESKTLRENLPWAYSSFDWDLERRTLSSESVKNFLKENDISLIKFNDL